MRSTRDALHRKIERLEADVKRLRDMAIPDYYKLSPLMLKDRVIARNQWIHEALAETDDIDGIDQADG
ncbi:hypothetical protein [Methylocaldum sp.]|uniref:hypothetical protein n=1 Tax=Methylocaldum sp. TaxID=1969727 RepID=UPI002D264DA3|nr:hypothetical protein [Methylocaldum sp.]HYE35477.1 hypothetical protein [Methylocaldum sp.]